LFTEAQTHNTNKMEKIFGIGGETSSRTRVNSNTKSQRNPSKQNESTLKKYEFSFNNQGKTRHSSVFSQIQLHNLSLKGNHPNKIRLKILVNEFPKMDVRLIENIIAYVNRLPKLGHDDIDDVIFKAQMVQHFDLKDTFMLFRIFTSLGFENTSSPNSISFLAYCRLMCIFLGDCIEYKINYAFEVYNIRGDGLLKKSELRIMLLHSTDLVGNDDEDKDDNFDFLLNLVMKMFDGAGESGNMDGEIDRGEFKSIIRQNQLMLECLGPCLPEAGRVDAFLEKVGVHRSKFEVMAIFRHERRRSLRTPETKVRGIQKYYPVDLEFLD